MVERKTLRPDFIQSKACFLWYPVSDRNPRFRTARLCKTPRFRFSLIILFTRCQQVIHKLSTHHVVESLCFNPLFHRKVSPLLLFLFLMY